MRGVKGDFNIFDFAVLNVNEHIVFIDDRGFEEQVLTFDFMFAEEGDLYVVLILYMKELFEFLN